MSIIVSKNADADSEKHRSETLGRRKWREVPKYSHRNGLSNISKDWKRTSCQVHGASLPSQLFLWKNKSGFIVILFWSLSSPKLSMLKFPPLPYDW